MYITQSNNENPTPLNGLTRLSSQPTNQRYRSARLRKLNQKDTQVSKTTEKEYSQIVAHAAPLSSLTEKDLQALAEIFESENTTEVEAELAQYLNLMYPEPCWEENPFGFLLDYL